jgi:radical SAM protein (TIGR01212 family)
MSKQKLEMSGKRYYRSYSSYLKERFGERVYRICLDAGMGCPNRDGKVGSGGCAFCSDTGSWGERGVELSLREQVLREKERIRTRYGANRFIAYFQAFSNTYAPPRRLKEIYDTVILGDDEVVGLCIGTRPDCIDAAKLGIVSSYLGDKSVWIEYGLQSAHDRTLKLIGRGHNVQAFTDAVRETEAHGIEVFAHVIIGLPGEGREENRKTAEYLAGLPVVGVKLHNLNIIRGTRLETWYDEGRINPLTLDEYAERVVDFLERTRPEIVVARLNTDTAARRLVEPKWSLDKQGVLTRIGDEFSRRRSYQGRLYQ